MGHADRGAVQELFTSFPCFAFRAPATMSLRYRGELTVLKGKCKSANENGLIFEMKFF
jgi:hypothetical protein